MKAAIRKLLSKVRRARRFHYYALSFMESRPGAGTVHAATYCGWSDRAVSKPRIEWAKEAAGVGAGAVLLSCCYLGRMTRAEMLGECEA
ncbi:hypothetical protein D3C81_318050 [compost metagenome]